jgi:hypothetical protein
MTKPRENIEKIMKARKEGKGESSTDSQKKRKILFVFEQVLVFFIH